VLDIPPVVDGTRVSVDCRVTLAAALPMAGSVAGTPAAAVFVSDPKSVAVRPPRVQRAQCVLTRREADLAALLADGPCIGEAADRMAVSKNTARSQLHQVFDKTGTRSQAALARAGLLSPNTAYVSQSGAASRRPRCGQATIASTTQTVIEDWITRASLRPPVQ